MTNIPLPRLIYSPKPAENATLPKEYHPIRVSITENITPLSTATIELPKGENLTARGYVELFTPKGSAGVFRVRSPEDAYGDEITRAELEHAITEVGDYLVTHEYSEMMAAGTAMQTIFGYYTSGHANGETARWQLNATALPSSNVAVTVNHERVLDAMLAILEQVPNYMMAFNFETSPWTVYFKQRDQQVTAEGRLSRNIESARITYDDSDLCTRVYYERQKANSEETEWVFKDADTMSTYGMIQRSMSVSSNYTTSEANAAADEYLRQHKEPRISIEVSAEDLHDATGEDLDSFLLGKLMRITIPDYEITQEKTITKISWADVYNKGYASVNLTLGQERDTAIKFLHDIDSSGGSASGGRNGGRVSRTINSTNQTIDLYKSKTDNNGKILEAAGLSIDEHDVLIYHDDYENQIGSRIQATEGMASMSVGQLDIPQNKIVTVTTYANLPTTGESDKYYKVEKPEAAWYVWEGNAESGSYKRIAVSYDGKHKYYIKAGEIAVAINEDGSAEAHIDAKKVILGQSQLTADDLETWAKDGNTHGGVFAKFLTVSSLTAQEIETVLANIGDAHIGGLYVDNSEQGADDAFIAGGLNIDHITFENQTEPLRLPGSDGYDDYAPHTVTINGTVQVTKILSTGDLSFSRATSLTPAWSGGATAGATATLTLTGSPDTSLTYEVVIGSGAYSATKTTLEVTSGGVATIDESVAKSVSVPVKINELKGSGTQPTQVYTKDITYSVASILESKTGSDKVTANGDVPLTEGMLGFSAVNVDVHPSLTGSWTGSVLTVTANPSASSGNGFDLGFSTYGTHKHDLEVTTGGTASKDSLVANSISVPVKVQKLNGSNVQPTELYRKDITYSIADLLEAKTGTNKITANGTYTPSASDGKIGFSSVVVEVDSGAERDSRINGYAQDSGTTSNVLTAYDTVYKLTSQYIDSSGNWADGGEYLVKTPASGGPSRNAKIEPSDFERIASGSGIADSQKQLDIRGDQWYKITPQYINATTGEYDSTTTAANIVYFKTPSVTILQALNPPSNWTNKGTLTRGRKVYVQYKHADGQTKNHPEYWEVPGNPSDYVSGLTKESQKVKTGVQRARSGVEFTAYYWDGNSSSYVSMGSHYWWYTDTSGYSSDDYDFYWKAKT